MLFHGVLWQPCSAGGVSRKRLTRAGENMTGHVRPLPAESALEHTRREEACVLAARARRGARQECRQVGMLPCMVSAECWCSYSAGDPAGGFAGHSNPQPKCRRMPSIWSAALNAMYAPSCWAQLHQPGAALLLLPAPCCSCNGGVHDPMLRPSSRFISFVSAARASRTPPGLSGCKFSHALRHRRPARPADPGQLANSRILVL